MKQEILQPVRHYNLHQDPLNNIETIHLVMWNNGLCIAGFDAEQNLLVAKVYNSTNWNVQVVEAIFVNEPLVAGPQHVTHIWLAEPRQLIVPQHLYEPEAARQWLKELHFVEEGESILDATVFANLNASLVFSVQNKWIDMFYKFFAEAKISALSKTLLCQPVEEKENTIDIVVLDHTALISVYLQGKLLSHQVIDNVDVQNLVYKIASICKDNGIKQNELSATLSGLCVVDNMKEELRAYFPAMMVDDTDENSSLTFLRKMIACA